MMTSISSNNFAKTGPWAFLDESIPSCERADGRVRESAHVAQDMRQQIGVYQQPPPQTPLVVGPKCLTCGTQATCKWYQKDTICYLCYRSIKGMIVDRGKAKVCANGAECRSLKKKITRWRLDFIRRVRLCRSCYEFSRPARHSDEKIAAREFNRELQQEEGSFIGNHKKRKTMICVVCREQGDEQLYVTSTTCRRCYELVYQPKVKEEAAKDPTCLTCGSSTGFRWYNADKTCMKCYNAAYRANQCMLSKRFKREPPKRDLDETPPADNPQPQFTQPANDAAVIGYVPRIGRIRPLTIDDLV